MPERATHTETVCVGTPFMVGSVTLLAIERVVLHSHRASGHAWCSAAKEPYALVVRDANGIRAIDTDAAAVSLEALREKVPGLGAVLAAM